MHEFRQFAKGITQAGNLAQVAVLVAILAAITIVFAERMAKESQQLTWAPWMQRKTATTFRRYGYVFAAIAAVCAVVSLFRFLTNI